MDKRVNNSGTLGNKGGRRPAAKEEAQHLLRWKDDTKVRELEAKIATGVYSISDVYYLHALKGNQELALGASRVVSEMLSLISEEENWKKLGNFHSTVKPIALMEYLVKLVSREGAIVLDPFAGSGSTLIACKRLGRGYIGIEREADYIKIAEARLANIKPVNGTLV